jgi:hypothetical protein
VRPLRRPSRHTSEGTRPFESTMEGLWSDIADAYDAHILDAGKETHFLILLAFLLTFGFIRTSTHMIKAEVSWWPGNVETKSGTHIHHMVWGILLLMVTGYLGLSVDMGSPWLQLAAVAFGIGMGLALDEFALWLYVQDVYWGKQGRKSIDAVAFTAALLIITLLGLQFWIDVREALLLALGIGGDGFEGSESAVLLIVLQLIGAGLAVVTVLKGRLLLGILGLFVPLVGLVGALLKPRPDSWWADRRGRPKAEPEHSTA